LEEFCSSLLRRSNYRTHALDISGSNDDLYDGGRYRGRGETSFDDYEGLQCQKISNLICLMIISHYQGDDDGRDSSNANARQEKKAREALIKNEFAARRKNSAKFEEKTGDNESLKNARVRGAEFTSTKISCLELKARESYLNLLEEVMRENYEKVKSCSDCSRILEKV